MKTAEEFFEEHCCGIKIKGKIEFLVRKEDFIIAINQAQFQSEELPTDEEIENTAKDLYPRNQNDEFFTPIVRDFQQRAFITGFKKALSLLSSNGKEEKSFEELTKLFEVKIPQEVKRLNSIIDENIRDFNKQDKEIERLRRIVQNFDELGNGDHKRIILESESNLSLYKSRENDLKECQKTIDMLMTSNNNISSELSTLKECMKGADEVARALENYIRADYSPQFNVRLLNEGNKALSAYKNSPNTNKEK